MTFIDSHAHITTVEKKINTRLAFDHLKFAIDIGLYPNDINDRIYLKEKYSNVKFSVGLYPSNADKNIEDIDKDLTILEQNIVDYRPDIIGLGECGLDYFHNYGTKENQKYLFIKQLEIARKFKLPILIHNREADEDVIEILKDFPDVTKVMHCFSSNAKTLKALQSLNCYISFAGNLTFKNAQDIQDAARVANRDLIIFETDAPFLTPVPNRGKTNSPENVSDTYRFFAELTNCDLNELCEKVENNFNKIFS